MYTRVCTPTYFMGSEWSFSLLNKRKESDSGMGNVLRWDWDWDWN